MNLIKNMIFKIFYFPIGIIACLGFILYHSGHTDSWFKDRNYKHQLEPSWIAFKEFWIVFFTEDII